MGAVGYWLSEKIKLNSVTDYAASASGLLDMHLGQCFYGVAFASD